MCHEGKGVDAILKIFLLGACGLLIGNTQVYVGIGRSILSNFLARLFSWDDLEDKVHVKRAMVIALMMRRLLTAASLGKRKKRII